MTRILAATAVFALIASQAFASPYEGNFFPELPSPPQTRDVQPDRSINTNSIAKPPLRKGATRPAKGTVWPNGERSRDMGE
ncbi:hypothetical protein [Rhizobium sp. BK251]|uniref:hypothetical protein n=1 Tax=Rhizobium sp. BK251 TaxID=2512125 RepID=UPI0010538B64|nr:hypothetical protein [Rhizobium sp. BK251]